MGARAAKPLRSSSNVSGAEIVPDGTSRAGVDGGGAHREDESRPLPAVGRPFWRTTRDRFAAQLRACDVELDGPHPWDPQIHDERLFDRVLRDGTLGLGEAYMDGWWDCERLDEFVARVVRAGLNRTVWGWRDAFAVLLATLRNAGKRSRAFEIGPRHYDLGNDLFAAMLDRRMTYSCACWDRARDLDAAQEAKLDLVCRKVGLEPGMRVLDIGCGWGSFAIFAAERYRVSVVGVTVSREQQRRAAKLAAGLPIEFRVQDYRDLDDRFDAIVSIGMFEHVGAKNYRTFFALVRRCLRKDGVFLLRTIGSLAPSPHGDRWIERYIFPNSHLPSMLEMVRAIGRSFVVEDWSNFGADYDRTLLAWERNFVAHWETLRSHYESRFYRMWRYYLLSCAGMFRARYLQLWQVVLARDGVPAGYRPSA